VWPDRTRKNAAKTYANHGSRAKNAGTSYSQNTGHAFFLPVVLFGPQTKQLITANNRLNKQQHATRKQRNTTIRNKETLKHN